MEVKIGVQNANRELSVESNQSSDEVQKLVTEALAGQEPILVLADASGRRVVVPTDKLAYVEISEESARRVGFGT